MTGAGPVRSAAESGRAEGWGPWLLGLTMLAAAYAGFAGGAIEIPAESRVQGAIALLGLAAVLGICLGRLAALASPIAWGGVACLGLLGVWSAASILWSILPDGSWLAANRATAYAVVVAVALAAAGSTRNAPVLVALALAVLTTVIAAWSLAGKLFPGVDLGPLHLDAGDRFARLREPLDYWNALGLICVIGSPVAIWLAAARDAAARYRVAAMVALTVLVLTAALSYSRGSVVAYAVVLAVMVGAGPRRLPRLAAGMGAVVAAGPCMLLAFTRHDLSASELPLSDRIDGGLMLTGVLALSLAAVVLGGRELVRLEGRIRWDAARSRRAWLATAAACVVAFAGGIAALAASDRGLTGEISHRVDEFRQPGTTLSNEPERLVSANGSSRYVWWQEALGAWSDRPLEGWGAGSFPTLHYLYRRYEAPARSSHSLLLMLASETGLVGLALGLGGIGLLGLAATARVRAARGAERSARLALATAAAAWFAHSLFDWHWEVPGVTIPALIALAVAAAPAPAGRAPLPAGRGRTAAAVGAAALAAAALITSATLPSLAEDARLQALSLAASGRLAEAAEEADLAHRLNPLAVEPLFTEASVATSRRRPREAVALLEEATRTQPDNWRADRRLVVALIGIGAGSQAAGAWRTWAEDDPLRFARGRKEIAAEVFAAARPPAESPNAYGTPPGR